MSRQPARTADRPGWRLAPYAFWADPRTLVGGDPFRSVRLTARGAGFVQGVLDDSTAPATGHEQALLDRLLRGNLVQRPAATPRAASDITLVIPARAGARQVQAVLDSAPGVPAIVVDDGSPVPLAGSLAHAAGLRVLRHEHPVGPAAARNAGASACSTRWVAFADADLVADPGWIERLAGYAATAVAVAPRVLGVPGTTPAARFEHAVCALDRGAQPGFVHPSGSLSYVPSAALLVDRAAFLAAGGFDASMPVGEDVDFVWRAARDGVYYEPSVVVGHRPRPSLPSAVRRRAAYGASAAALADRHPGLMHHGSFPLAAALPTVLLLAGRPRLAASASVAHLALAPRSMRQLPAAAAVRAAATGQARTALALSRLLSRPLGPATLLAAARSRGLGARALAAAVAGALLDRRVRSAPGPAIEGVCWQLLDDAAYAAGVWRSAWLARRPGLLLPRFRLGGAVRHATPETRSR